MKELKELLSETSDYKISLSKLTDKKIVDAIGYTSGSFGFPVFTITDLVCDGGSIIKLQGEHDCVFIPQSSDDRMPPNMDEQSLMDLYELENGEPFEE